MDDVLKVVLKNNPFAAATKAKKSTPKKGKKKAVAKKAKKQ